MKRLFLSALLVLISVASLKADAGIYRVYRVPKNDVLLLRTGPGEHFTAVDKLDAFDNYVSIERCEGRWCLVPSSPARTGGWADRRFLLKKENHITAPEFTIVVGQNAQPFHLGFGGLVLNITDHGSEGISYFAGWQQSSRGYFSLPKMIRFGTTYGVNNAFAFIYRGRRYLVHDKNYFVGVTKSSREAREVYVYGHEFGHHACGHNEIAGDRWTAELEADRYAGAFLKQVELSNLESMPGYIETRRRFIREGVKSHSGNDWAAEIRYYEAEMKKRDRMLTGALEEMAKLLPVGGSATHPPRSMRIAAVREGYAKGSPCVEREEPDLTEGYVPLGEVVFEEGRIARFGEFDFVDEVNGVQQLRSGLLLRRTSGELIPIYKAPYGTRNNMYDHLKYGACIQIEAFVVKSQSVNWAPVRITKCR